MKSAMNKHNKRSKLEINRDIKSSARTLEQMKSDADEVLARKSGLDIFDEPRMRERRNASKDAMKEASYSAKERRKADRRQSLPNQFLIHSTGQSLDQPWWLKRRILFE